MFPLPNIPREHTPSISVDDPLQDPEDSGSELLLPVARTFEEADTDLPTDDAGGHISDENTPTANDYEPAMKVEAGQKAMFKTLNTLSRAIARNSAR